jgi:putative hydrolase of the HAD superfamily
MDHLSLLTDVDLIIVDLGGVLYDIDFERTRKAMMALDGYNGRPVEFSADVQNDLFLRVDRGELVVDDFLAELRKTWGFTCSDDDLIDAWNAVLKEPFPWAVDVIRAMRTYAKVVLLSNISWLHLWVARPQCRDLFSEFDRLYFSCSTGLRKPDPEAFIQILRDMNVAAARTILYDDSIANCKVATGLGLHVVRVKNPAEEFKGLLY